MNCQRRRSGPSFEVDAAPTPLRRRGGDCGAFHRHAPDDPDDPSPATARRAVVIGLQPAANGRGCGLCV